MRSMTYRTTHNRPLVEQALLALFSGLLLFLAFASIYALGYQVRYMGSIFPGVRIAGVEVGGMTPREASTRLTASLNYPQTGRILLRYNEQTWLVTPGQVGLFLDPETTAQKAYQIGRGAGFFNNLNQELQARSAGVDISPTLIFDQRMAYNYLISLAAQIDKPVIEPSISINGVDVVVQQGQVGHVTDISATLSALAAQVQTFQDGVVDLVVPEIRPVIGDVSQQAELARTILSQPLTLSMQEGLPDQKGPWVFEPADLARYLVFKRVDDPNQARYELDVDRASLAVYLANLAPSIEQTPENTHFIFNDDSHQLEVIQPAVIGRVLDIETTVNSIHEKLFTGEHSVPLAFTFTPPAITDDMTGEQLGITELVYAETSYFRGSTTDRIQNIKTASGQFHGLLVPPWATFSMASALGDITLDNGYAEALIIVGDQTVQGVGGGVCQVSTTLFRTVFFAGYPIVERHAHAYRVYYYEQVPDGHEDSLAGLDATVFVPLVDFKFTNDSPNWLLMETYINESNSSLTWKFYSTKDGRSVDWQTTGPSNIVPAPDPAYEENPELPSGEVKKIDYAADGADITVTRTVLKDGAVYLQDSIQTHYEPWQEKFEYGPGTEGMPPEDNPDEDSEG